MSSNRPAAAKVVGPDPGTCCQLYQPFCKKKNDRKISRVCCTQRLQCAANMKSTIGIGWSTAPKQLCPGSFAHTSTNLPVLTQFCSPVIIGMQKRGCKIQILPKMLSVSFVNFACPCSQATEEGSGNKAAQSSYYNLAGASKSHHGRNKVGHGGLL